MKKIALDITAMDDEGRGRGTFEGPDGPIDVAALGAFVGDTAEVDIERQFKQHGLWVGRARTISVRGVCHVERLCTHQEPCSACPMHGSDKSLEVGVKVGRIEQALSDAHLDYEVDDFVFHPNEFGYRQRIKLMAGMYKQELRFGVFVPYSHIFAPAECCPYVRPEINEALSDVQRVLQQEKVQVHDQEQPGLKAAILRAGREGVHATLVVTAPLPLGAWERITELVDRGHLLGVRERLQRSVSNYVLSGELTRSYGAESLSPIEGGPLVDAESFCQSDPDQAVRMYDCVAEYMTEASHEGVFVDAYAGVGGFARALQRRDVKNIIAIEQSESARSALLETGATVYLCPLSEALPRLKAHAPITGLIVDPPKKGLVQDAQPLADLKAHRIALVSCDPDAMAKDLRVFVDAGYTVDRILPFDLFGGTPAIETVVLMRYVS